VTRDRRQLAATLAAIGITAFVLRVIGLQFGLPAVYNPDEIAIVARALTFAKGTLNPQNFLYPTFFFYVLFAWIAVYLAFVWLTGDVSSVGQLQQLYYANPTGIYTAARALGVVSGTATVLLLYRLGTRLTNPRAAVAAATFLAVAPLHVRDSHYVKHDVPATLTIVLAYLAMTRVWPCARPSGASARDAVLAGAACGIAFSVHYYCVFLTLPLLWVIVQAWRSAGWGEVARHALAAGVTSAVVFFVLSPFLLVEPFTAWRDIAANRQIVVDRATASGAFAPMRRYVEILWTDSLGMPVVMLAAAGVIWMIATRLRLAVFLLAFPVAFFLFIANTFPASRYLNPVLPFAALFAGWVLSVVVPVARAPGWLFAVAVIVVALPGAIGSVRSDLFFRRDDTRTVARRGAESVIPPGSTVLIQPQSAPLSPSRESLVEALRRNLGSVDAASTKFQLQLAQEPYPAPSYRLLYLGKGLDAEKIYVDYAELGGRRELEALHALGVQYVVVKRYNRPDPGTLPFLTALDRGGRRIARFSPYRPDVSEVEQARIEPFLHNTDTRIDAALERPGPVVEIWQLDSSGS
jgi:hypothetical protein